MSKNRSQNLIIKRSYLNNGIRLCICVLHLYMNRWIDIIIIMVTVYNTFRENRFICIGYEALGKSHI